MQIVNSGSYSHSGSLASLTEDPTIAFNIDYNQSQGNIQLDVTILDCHNLSLPEENNNDKCNP